MNRIQEFLTAEWIEREIAARTDARGNLRAALEHGLLTSIGQSEQEAEWDMRLRDCMHLCELEYARGTAAARIREMSRETVEAFVPQLAAMDFSPQTTRVEGGMGPSAAKRLAEQFGGHWWKSGGQYAGVEFTAIAQPFRSQMPRVWMLAAVAGDRDLARNVSAPYRLHAPEQMSARYEIREAVLRHALAEDTQGEQALARRLEPGYPTGEPPMLIDFPLGVFAGDVEALSTSIKRLSNNMKNKWNMRKTRAWFDKQSALHRPGTWRSPGTWEECLDGARRALLHYQWFVSWWALAWLNVARWRGMGALFEKPQVFTEWVPLELCR